MIDQSRLEFIRGDNSVFLERNRNNPSYRHETRLQIALDTEYLLSLVDRAYEALESLRTPESARELIVKHRLGAFVIADDARNAIIDYGLGKRDPDPSVGKEIK